MTQPTIKILLALLTFAMMTGAASAQQQRTYYDARGNSLGRSTTDSQGTVTNYDARGRVISRAQTDSQGTTTVYDAGGRNVGRFTTAAPGDAGAVRRPRCSAGQAVERERVR
jgi:YD repeat-containing protein